MWSGWSPNFLEGECPEYVAIKVGPHPPLLNARRMILGVGVAKQGPNDLERGDAQRSERARCTRRTHQTNNLLVLISVRLFICS